MKNKIVYSFVLLFFLQFCLNQIGYSYELKQDIAEIMIPVSSTGDNPVIEIFDSRFAAVVEHVLGNSETHYTREKYKTCENEPIWELKDSKLGFVVTIYDGDNNFNIKKVVVVGNSFLLEEDTETLSRKIPPDRGLEACIFTLLIQKGIFTIEEDQEEK